MRRTTATIKRLAGARDAGPGFTLVEALITIGLAAILLAVYTAMLTATVFLRRAHYNVQAAMFIQEELDTLRTLPYADLINRTNGRFLGLAFTRGPWRVTTVTTPPSGTKALAMTTAQTAIVEETGLAVLPGDHRMNATVSAKMNVLNASPAGWGAGIAFRYRDAENHYRFRITSGGAAFDKVSQGTRTTLWSNTTANTKDTWYTLEVVMTDNQYTIKRNGATLTTVTDNTFTTPGEAALITIGSAQVHVDDVTVSAPTATTWNFDADADGTVPDDWERLSFYDLPSGTGTLTIANYLGETNVKQATVTVSWNDAGATRSATGATLIAK